MCPSTYLELQFVEKNACSYERNIPLLRCLGPTILEMRSEMRDIRSRPSQTTSNNSHM